MPTATAKRPVKEAAKGKTSAESVRDNIARPTTRAVVKYIHRSPYKVRQVASLIRGKDAEAAQNELLLCERSAADEVSRLLNSAIANAEHNQQIPAEELRVKEIFVDEGPTMKRFRARARGRGSRIFKRTSHITIVLERMTPDELEMKMSREASSGAANSREQRRRRTEASKAKAAEAESSSVAASNPPAEERSEPEVSSLSADAPSDDSAPADKPVKAAKKTTAKKTTAKKTTAKKTTAKKTTTKKTDDKKEDK
jgi:large subunit ribosomal protein L22